ncbi:hypothetical protein KC878_04320 [Candidatus Saccharibacteria bacterium]|nr:hypothetical protein [Candidatus Saccharibacteria bacterium]MCB9821610.1 hypothetical protein [Candidatus Nomurabacteria bacterium]
MSYAISKKLNVGILLTLVLCALFGGRVSAQDAAAGADQPQARFSYSVKAGDNLTKLVRRSIELYAGNADISLSQGQAIAAETEVVQAMGAYELNIGQTVDIDEQAVMTAVESAKLLSTAAEQRWNAYGPIKRNLVDISPVSAPSYVQTETSNPNTENPADTSSDNNTSSDQASTQESADDVAGTDQSAAWYWWFVGGGAIGAMWYVLGGSEAVKARKTKTSRKK